MGFIRKWFHLKKYRDHRQEHGEIVSSDTKGKSETGSKNSSVIPTSLPEAIRFVVSERGCDYLCQRGFINILDDYHLLKDLPALKNVLLSMQTEGYIQKLVSAKSWDIVSANILHQFINAYGTREDFVEYVVKSFEYGLGHTNTMPTFVGTGKTTLSEKQRIEETPVTQVEYDYSSSPLIGEDPLNMPINPKEPFIRYQYPTIDLLKHYENDGKLYIDESEQLANKNQIVKVLNSFGVQIREIKATVGPTITLYEIIPAEGVRISKIRNLQDDIALSLAAMGIRIVAPIPGKGTVGIEVPNATPSIVSMRSILDSTKFQESKMELPIAVGKTVNDEVFMVDLAKIPHLLVAGAPSMSISSCLHAIITSLLYKKHPNELKLVLIDPKKAEFSVYSPIANHFMAYVDDDDEVVVTDVTKAVRTLESLCVLMDHRYDLLKLAKAHNVKEYNQKYVNHQLSSAHGHKYMPYIVVIIDEFGDLIIAAGKEIELPMTRIAQLARAVGIHLVISTQRITSGIITGNIKAYFPGRMAFRVATMRHSIIILDRPGACQLLGRGDMLFLNGYEPIRVQCAFIDTPEVETVNEYISKQIGPAVPLNLSNPISKESMFDGAASGIMDGGSILDPLFEEAALSVVLSQQGSTTMIQRRYSIGFNRAERLMNQLEKFGVVGHEQRSRTREVLIPDENSLNCLFLTLKEKGLL